MQRTHTAPALGERSKDLRALSSVQRVGLLRARRVALTFFALVAGGGQVHAQTAAPPAATAPTQSPGGGFDRLQIGTTGRAIYASNVAGGSKALAALRGLKPSDMIYQVQADVALRQPVGRQLLFLNTTAAIDRYDANSSLDAENLSGTMGGVVRLTKCSLVVSGGYARRQTPASELLLAVQKNSQVQANGDGQASCLFGSVQTGLRAQHAEITNSAKTAGYVDSTIDSAGGNIGYENEIFGNLSLFTQYTRIRYDLTAVPGLAPTPGVQTYGGGLSYKRKIGQRLSGEIEFGYTYADSKDPTVKFDGYTTDINLNYNATKRTSVRAGYNRGVQASSRVFSTFAVNNSKSLDASYALTPRLTLNLQGAVESNVFKGIPAEIRQVREEQRRTIRATATVKIGKNITVELQGDYIDRNTDLPEFDEKSHRTSVAVIGKF